MFRIKAISIILLLLCSISSNAQLSIGFSLPPKQDKAEIPFSESCNLIIVPVIINNFLKLNFILDSGVDTPILTEKAFANLAGIEFIREISISGAGLEDSIGAYIGHHVDIKLPGNIHGQNLNLLVLKEDYLKLSEKLGIDVHGIIGYDLFKNFVVAINYDDKILTLTKPSSFKCNRKYRSIDLEISNSKPFIQTLLTNDKSSAPAKLMIDTGASHALLLDVDQTEICPPNHTIVAQLGTGLGGIIPGNLGRLDSFRVSEFEFDHVIVSIPEIDAYSQSIKRGSRQGTIGGDILSRLSPIFDYQNNKLYIRRADRYKNKFEFDMSGISIAAKGEFLDSLVVEHVRENSPAAECGMLVGDHILSINGFSLMTHKLSEIQRVLQKKPNHKVRIKLIRDNQKIKKVFRLKRTI